MKYPIITKEVKILLKMLDEDSDKVELINALIDYSEDGTIDTDGLSDKVCEAFMYLTENVKILFWGEGEKE